MSVPTSHTRECAFWWAAGKACSHGALVGHGKPAPAQEHSETSKAAARRIEARRSSLRQRVIDAILVNGGLTDEEGIRITEMSPSTYRPRRIELVELNAVEDSGLTRKTKSGRSAVVWRAVS